MNTDEKRLKKEPSRLTRRFFFVGAGGLLLVGGAAGYTWFNVGAQIDSGDLSVQDAHRAAMAGDILLLDIRRPDEWARTGIGEGAVPLDMRRADFVAALQAELKSGPKPIALICARGVRSARLAARLDSAGISPVINVPQGMLGSGAGPGWLEAGLPIIPYDDAS